MWLTKLFSYLIRDPIRDGVARRLAAIERLPLPEARQIAMNSLRNSSIFRCLESKSDAKNISLPVGVAELFSRYAAIEMADEDTWLRRDAIGTSLYIRGFTRIGHSHLGSDNFEVCVRDGSEKVYDLSGFGRNESDFLKASSSSVYHWIIFHGDIELPATADNLQ